MEHVFAYLYIIQQIWDIPTTKCKIEFSAVLQSLCTAKTKSKSDTFIYTFSRKLCFNSSKIVLKKLFWLKLLILKNTLSAFNPLIPGGNKSSYILKQDYSF